MTEPVELMIRGKAVVFEEWEHGFTIMVKSALRTLLFEWTPDQGVSRKHLGRLLLVLSDSKNEIPEYTLSLADQIFKNGILDWRRRIKKDGKTEAALAQETDFKMLYSTFKNHLERALAKAKREPTLDPEEQQRRLASFIAKFEKKKRIIVTGKAAR